MISHCLLCCCCRWNPKFDSFILEEQYWKSTFPRTTIRFQFGLIYLLVLELGLTIYFPAKQTPLWPYFLGVNLTGALLLCIVLSVTQLGQDGFYQKHCYKVSVFTSLVLCSFSLVGVSSLNYRSAKLITQSFPGADSLFLNHDPPQQNLKFFAK